MMKNVHTEAFSLFEKKDDTVYKEGSLYEQQHC